MQLIKEIFSVWYLYFYQFLYFQVSYDMTNPIFLLLTLSGKKKEETDDVTNRFEKKKKE